MRLEDELRALGADALGPAPPVLDRALARIASERDRRPARRTARVRRLSPALVALLILLLLAGGVAAVPDARSAVLEWLGLRGAVVRQGVVPRRAPTPLERVMSSLGERTTLERARQRAGFPLVVPTGLGAPLEVRFAPDLAPGGAVSARYAGPVLFVAVSGSVTPVIQKLVGSRDAAARVRVDGEPGIWLEGGPHFFAFVAADGNVREDTSRLSRNVLLWERDGLLLRLEGVPTRAAALAIARSAG